MDIKIRKDILNKIREAEDGEALAERLQDFKKRPNIEYTRGILHGFLLALTVQGIIDNADALEILEQLAR